MALQKGNKLGKKFKAGESGNPKGRPHDEPSAMLKEYLARPCGERGAAGRTNAEMVARALVRSALRGYVRAIALIFERTEGKVARQRQHSLSGTIQVEYVNDWRNAGAGATGNDRPTAIEVKADAAVALVPAGHQT